MTLIVLPRIPNDVAAGATVTWVPDTSKNTSQGGVSSRKRMRQLIRNYIVTPSPTEADEMQALIMCAGTDELLCMKDPAANVLTNEAAVLAADGITAQIGKNWTPATGSLTRFERVLLVAGSPAVYINGDPATSGQWTLGDYGVLTFSPPLTFGVDDVTVSCDYLQVVAFMDGPSATVFGGGGQYQLHDLRLEQILPAEYIRRTT